MANEVVTAGSDRAPAGLKATYLNALPTMFFHYICRQLKCIFLAYAPFLINLICFRFCIYFPVLFYLLYGCV